MIVNVSQCYVALTNIDSALKDLNKVIQCSPDDKVAHADRECLLALRLAFGTSSSGSAGPTDISIFQKASIMLTKQLNIQQIKNIADIHHNSSILHSHSQIIPNANRTKYQKMRAIRHNQQKERQQQQNGHHQLIDSPTNMTQDSTIQAILRGQDRQLPSATDYYKQNIFNRQDFFLYRAVMHFYAGQYAKALNDFQKSSQVMHANKVLNTIERDDIDNLSDDSGATDLSDVGLCSLNIHQYSYNAMLCQWMLKDFQGVLKRLQRLVSTTPIKYLHKLWLLKGLVNQQVGNFTASKKDIENAMKYDSEHAKKVIEGKEQLILNIFPVSNRLCSHFSYVKFSLSAGYNILMKPSFSFPFIKPPNMIPIVDPNYLSEIDISLIKPVPQAPWIKRAGNFIKFTDDIFETDLDFGDAENHRLNKTQDKEKQRRKKQRGYEPVIKSFSQRGIVLPSMLEDEVPIIERDQESKNRLGDDDDNDDDEDFENDQEDEQFKHHDYHKNMRSKLQNERELAISKQGRSGKQKSPIKTDINSNIQEIHDLRGRNNNNRPDDENSRRGHEQIKRRKEYKISVGAQIDKEYDMDDEDLQNYQNDFQSSLLKRNPNKDDDDEDDDDDDDQDNILAVDDAYEEMEMREKEYCRTNILLNMNQ